ncbi:response regulator (plasmid) [Streptomyces laculatispora]|uniref:Response regulator n=1 Tax=Streptomyces laculatispora TaxID=887464 RepID=A0ABY9IG16_9ACTN|nr:response regulator [Streptomyces laculatispora]WLQ45609.1 response regulator [Streptomyces laculatispora]
MRILVVDDMLIVESGVARAVEEGGHMVVGARDPAALRVLLEQDTDFQLAFVDLHYGRSATESGLAALEALDQHSIPSVVFSADGEQNRLLFLLAAFEFFPETSTFLSKHAGDQTINSIVEAIGRGDTPNAGPSRRYRPSRKEPASYLQQLVRRSSDLPLWRALAMHTTLSVIAGAAHCSQRKVSMFISERQPVIAALQQQMLDLPVVPAVREGERNTPLLEVCRFAQPNADFFNDPDVERLIDQAWGDRPLQRSAASRFGDAYRRKMRK